MMTPMRWSMRCWYMRWQMSSALDQGDLASRLGRGHAAGCAACQAYGRALGSLHEQLSRGVHAAHVPVVVARRTRWPLLVLAPIAASAVVIALVVGTGDGPAPRGVDAPSSSSSLSLSFPVSTSLLRVRQVADSVSQALATTPLDTELDALVHDGRRGLDALLATGGLR
jgi:hypothetical protein